MKIVIFFSNLHPIMKYLLIILSCSLFFSCQEKAPISTKPTKKQKLEDTTTYTNLTEPIKEDTISHLESLLITAGLVDIQKIDSTIYIDIKYSTTDNFMEMDLYGDFAKAYLQPDVAEKLSKAQQFLKEEYPDYSLLVYDGVRPRHVQQMMWDSLKLPFKEKTKFISNPKNGSIHNYGAAVDLTIIDEKGTPLDMATPYDFIGKLAYPRLEQTLLTEGKISQQQINNRALLRKAMKKAGFFGIQTEWWHFNSCTRNEAKLKYKIVE